MKSLRTGIGAEPSRIAGHPARCLPRACRTTLGRWSKPALLLLTLEHCQAAAASPEERSPGTASAADGPCRAVEYPILYASPRSSGGLDAHIFSMRSDASTARLLADQGDFYGAVWSPEGRRIAFRRVFLWDSSAEPASEVGLMTSDEGGAVSLLVDAQPALPTVADHHRRDAPSWSADGRIIAFASQREDARWAIWSIPASGGAPRRLLPQLETPHYDASFSPRALDEIVYVAESGNGADIWRAELSRSRQENLTDGRVEAPRSPRISPDGRRLVFSAARQQSNQSAGHDLYVLELSTREVRALTRDGGDDFAPVWAPDAESVLFSRLTKPLDGSAQSLELWRAALDGPEPAQQLTRDLTANFASDWYAHASCASEAPASAGAAL